MKKKYDDTLKTLQAKKAKAVEGAKVAAKAKITTMTIQTWTLEVCKLTQVPMWRSDVTILSNKMLFDIERLPIRIPTIPTSKPSSRSFRPRRKTENPKGRWPFRRSRTHLKDNAESMESKTLPSINNIPKCKKNVQWKFKKLQQRALAQNTKQLEMDEL